MANNENNDIVNKAMEQWADGNCFKSVSQIFHEVADAARRDERRRCADLAFQFARLCDTDKSRRCYDYVGRKIMGECPVLTNTPRDQCKWELDGRPGMYDDNYRCATCGKGWKVSVDDPASKLPTTCISDQSGENDD